MRISKQRTTRRNSIEYAAAPVLDGVATSTSVYMAGNENIIASEVNTKNGITFENNICVADMVL